MKLDSHYIRWMLSQEARSLLTRLNQVKPFALSEPTLAAAQVSYRSQVAIEKYLMTGRAELRQRVLKYLRWLQHQDGQPFNPVDAQRRLSLLRLRFNATLSQMDIFADALTQRSEHDTGVWLAGLDAAAEAALRLEGYIAPLPLICYLDRGAGAAIRRARTRLPGGGENPVAVIRVPRERMIGSGIASSLFHEVGHQAAALLDWVNSLRMVLKQRQTEDGNDIWHYWERWISEIVADCWAVAQVGITSTVGLIGVVSLPKAFVFRMNLDDPHPFPWLRVKLSCAMGQAIYPHPQWQRLASLWEAFYPKSGLDDQRLQLIDRLLAAMPTFVALLINHRPLALQGLSVVEALATQERTPGQLLQQYQHWRQYPKAMYSANPVLAFAVLGQARFDGKLSPEQESTLLTQLLRHWALRKNLVAAAACSQQVSNSPFSRMIHQPQSNYRLTN